MPVKHLPDPNQDAVRTIAREAAIKMQQQIEDALNCTGQGEWLVEVAQARIDRIHHQPNEESEWVAETLCDPFMQIGYECLAAQLNRLIGIFFEIHVGHRGFQDFKEIQDTILEWIISRSTDRVLDREDLEEWGFRATAPPT